MRSMSMLLWGHMVDPLLQYLKIAQFLFSGGKLCATALSSVTDSFNLSQLRLTIYTQQSKHSVSLREGELVFI
jgi:hypothetical protein